MSGADDALDLALQRMRRDRLRYQGLPCETPLEIVRDAVERIMLTPEAKAWEAAGIGAAESGASLLFELLGVPAPVVGLGVKGLDFLIHVLLNAAEKKAREDQAREADEARRAAEG